MIPIIEARATDNGRLVTVEGIVTRAFGRLTRIQDETGGLSVFDGSGAFRTAVDSGDVRGGDLLRVTGELAEFASLKQIGTVLSFEILSRENELPPAQVLTLAEVASNGEEYESELIRVIGLTADAGGATEFATATTYSIVDKSDSSGAVTLRTANTGDTDIEGAPIPITFFGFEGVLGQFDFNDPAAGYQLQIVRTTDVLGGVVIPIDSARVTDNDEVVTVEGVATRAKGRFAYIQDETAGITLFQSSGFFVDAIANGDVQMGDRLRITGVLSEFSSLKELGPNIIGFEVVSRGKRVA